ncbi:DSD1 family PLP-dependent enzyme [Vibrio paucivorans]|uniref:DSD1 family PLP-dependent enzyme n=1 Tax=Vibrio paucivorans TaxID=2829489 RepID=A0A9X3CI56_9VIBR|nr:DSD1 family PLP-dependent enzyme [Vibrio paucivorans]MCW8336262.1 DSD1 family PLP-dependent enzyme [Vibrio paucivorans]
MKITQLDTPALIVDLDILEQNLSGMQKRINQLGLALRPHTKAHKIPALAHMQIAAGAIGVCTSKLGEAEVMVEGGVNDVLITTPIAGETKTKRLVDLCLNHPNTTIRQVIDHAYHVDIIGKYASQNGIEIGLLVEVESGQERCGVNADQALIELINHIKTTEGVRYDGIQAYSGHLQLIKGYEKRQRAAHDAVDSLFTFIETALKPQGLAPKIISGAGTGTYQAHSAHAYTEVQAGSYLFMDSTYTAIGDENNEDTNRQFSSALSVLSTVISHPSSGRAVVDAGMKSLSIDLGMPKVREHSDTVTYKCGGDEHGILLIEQGKSPYEIGQVISLIPSHCDTTLHNFDVLNAVRDGEVIHQWRIQGRGRSD